MTPDTIAGAWEFINSGAVLACCGALLTYTVINERRLTKLETIIEILTKTEPQQSAVTCCKG